MSDFRNSDKPWFPSWLKHYAEFAQHGGRSGIPLTRELAVGFSRALLARRIPAWQRQQAVRALAACVVHRLVGKDRKGIGLKVAVDSGIGVSTSRFEETDIWELDTGFTSPAGAAKATPTGFG